MYREYSIWDDENNKCLDLKKKLRSFLQDKYIPKNLPRGYQCKGSEEKELPEQAQKAFFAPGKNAWDVIENPLLQFDCYIVNTVNFKCFWELENSQRKYPTSIHFTL